MYRKTKAISEYMFVVLLWSITCIIIFIKYDSRTNEETFSDVRIEKMMKK